MQTLTRRGLVAGVIAGAAAVGLVWSGSGATAQVSVDDDDIGGVVRGASGPEAGVWVIAETDDFDTLYRKIVVTDDGGRYVLPDLPDARYRVWVRGYGLTDSQAVMSRPGATLDLRAVQAASPSEAAQIFPANYWYSLVEVPPESEFPGTGPEGNGISPGMRSQANWIDGLKQGCQLCHQLGNQATREVLNPGDFDSTEAAWAHRVRAGQRGALMSGGLRRFGADRSVAMYAGWTDRIMAGELPPVPPRPQGRERNVVLTLWEWGGEAGYIHDEVASDKRDPRVNAGGPVYGVEFANDKLVWVDPTTNEARDVRIPLRDTPGEGDFLLVRQEREQRVGRAAGGDRDVYVILRVPYPMGFYSRGMDGRIDDPSAGWKGRAVWADYGTNAVWHSEGGKGVQGNLVKFQVRPDPLAH